MDKRETRVARLTSNLLEIFRWIFVTEWSNLLIYGLQHKRIKGYVIHMIIYVKQSRDNNLYLTMCV